MSVVISLLCIFVAPVLLAVIAAAASPSPWSAYTAIAVFFPATFVGISIATDIDGGRVSSMPDAFTAVKEGMQWFLWWLLVMSCCIGAAWAAAVMS
jgi:hypothetical protein